MTQKNYFAELEKDYRFKEGFHTCINCGTCTAVCPAAEFYKYDPRKIVSIVQTKDDDKIEDLLKSDTIWYCGECMSCVTRCPRKNGPGLVIMALRDLSIRLGFFTESEKGRQILLLSHILINNVLKYGYCVHPDSFRWEQFKESGLVWKWHNEHLKDSLSRLGIDYMGTSGGVLRKVPQESLDELEAIFEVTGANERLHAIEHFSEEKAKELNMTMPEYENQLFTYSSGKHYNE